MVNRVLTSPYLWWFDPFSAGLTPAIGRPTALALYSMAMTASFRPPQGAGSQESERSPFARLTELLAPYQPGKPLITLSLGEPQHPVPGFVGPVLASAPKDEDAGRLWDAVLAVTTTPGFFELKRSRTGRPSFD